MYVEHNILDWYEDEVKKLGNFDFVPENDFNNYNVVVEDLIILHLITSIKDYEKN